MRRYPRLNGYFEEILSDALYGTAQALAHYDPSLGVPFGAYASARARGEVMDGIRRRSPLSRWDVAHGATRDTAPQAALTPVPLEDWTVLIPAQREPSEYERGDDRDQISRLLATLSPKQAQVLREHDLAGRYLRDIAADLGVTESRVCQIRTEALKKLRLLA